MPVIAIIGAGPGLGLSKARRIWNRRLPGGLDLPDQERLDSLAAQLTAEGIEAAGLAGSVTEADA